MFNTPLGHGWFKIASFKMTVVPVNKESYILIQSCIVRIQNDKQEWREDVISIKTFFLNITASPWVS